MAMNKKDYEKLAQALAMAKKNALMYADYDDGGTCNFDTPYVYLDGTTIKTLEKYFGEEYAVYKRFGWSKYIPHCFTIGHKVLSGQGNRRTKMAEVFANTLRDYGYNAGVHYVID